MLIRDAVQADLAALAAVERAAGEAFRAIGMDAIADGEPFTVSELAAYRVLVAVIDDPVGYLLAGSVDAATHVEQVSVHPAFARRGIGRRLIDHLDGPLTLTAFRDVPWNAPYYARIGFAVLDTLTLGLVAIRAREAAAGLDRWPRVAMRRPVPAVGFEPTRL